MAQQGSEASVASSSPTPNWWEIHTNPISSWNAMNTWQPLPNSSCEDPDMSNISTASFANASSMGSSSADLSGELAENHLWSQVLFSVGNGGADHLHHGHDGGESFLEVLSSQSPACNYLKKLDRSWEFANHSPTFSSSYNSGAMIEPERLANLSDLVSNWSIAPPNTTTSNFTLSQIKHELPAPPSYPGNGCTGYMPPHLDQIGAPFGYQVSLHNSMIGLGACLNKPRPSVVKGSETSSTKGSGRGSGTASDGKKKRSEDGSETMFKKSRHESSNASSVKIQPPKVKLGDKITALQQIVSPFGKTDTASVLLEAINYIRFLQEQVQLLSDPYLKSSANKVILITERRDKADSKLDLRSRGLCLVPVSCTPQAYRENTGPDYWTPTYRGCLYR